MLVVVSINSALVVCVFCDDLFFCFATFGCVWVRHLFVQTSSWPTTGAAELYTYYTWYDLPGGEYK